jgi:hypothetical protein
MNELSINMWMLTNVLLPFLLPFFVALFTTYFVNSLWKYPILRIDNYKTMQITGSKIPVDFTIKNFGDSPVMAYWIFNENIMLDRGYFVNKRDGLINPTREFPLFTQNASAADGTLPNKGEKEIILMYRDGFPLVPTYYITKQIINFNNLGGAIKGPVDICVSKRISFWEKKSYEKLINDLKHANTR